MDETINASERPPRRRRKEARPAELVRAGLEEFALNGFAATRLEDVARRAGVVKGTIYRYFADKEALFWLRYAGRLLQYSTRSPGSSMPIRVQHTTC
jgi:AcrR family transcriptional regulator